MNYTRGKWFPRLRSDGSRVIYAKGEDDFDFEMICQDVRHYNNMNLIAAAPDMYEALSEIKQYLETHDLPDVVSQQVLERKCSWALAKAEGITL